MAMAGHVSPTGVFQVKCESNQSSDGPHTGVSPVKCESNNGSQTGVSRVECESSQSNDRSPTSVSQVTCESNQISDWSATDVSQVKCKSNTSNDIDESPTYVSQVESERNLSIDGSPTGVSQVKCEISPSDDGSPTGVSQVKCEINPSNAEFEDQTAAQNVNLNNASPELETKQADNPLVLRSTVPKYCDSDKLFKKLDRVFRYQKVRYGIVCAVVEFRVDAAQTKCLVQVELRKENGHGYHLCPWPSCRYTRRKKYQVADHIRKLHFGPNFCAECGHIYKSLPSVQHHRRQKGHTEGSNQPLFKLYQVAALRRYCRDLCSEFSVPFPGVQ